MTYIPKVFKRLTDEDYLQCAIETANWLKTLEIKTEHGKIWKNFPDDQNGFGRDIMLFGPTNIYSGSAGTMRNTSRKQRKQQIILSQSRQMQAGMMRHFIRISAESYQFRDGPSDIQTDRWDRLFFWMISIR